MREKHARNFFYTGSINWVILLYLCLMSNKLITTGTLKLIGERKAFNSGSYKTDFVLTIPQGQYTQEVQFEAWKEKADMVSGLQVGSQLEVTFDLGGREWNGRYFVSLKAYEITIKSQPQPAAQPASFTAAQAGAAYPHTPAQSAPVHAHQEVLSNDDLPF
jgi:hypothetical protein